jgi:hypothetical protein
LNELAAFLKVWPDGADVMDRRFEMLAMTMTAGFDRLAYTTAKVNRASMPKPKQRKISEFTLFARGQKAVRNFADMTQEQIAERMRRFAKAVKKHG